MWECAHCCVQHTSARRRGPLGAGTLCSSCGNRWARWSEPSVCDACGRSFCVRVIGHQQRRTRNLECEVCGARTTPQWRFDGGLTVCNRDYLRAKRARHRRRAAEAGSPLPRWGAKRSRYKYMDE